MNNAFKILGATPYDNIDKLNNIYEEKSANDSENKELYYAYEDLKNEEARIPHEIIFFYSVTFEEFENLFPKNNNVSYSTNIQSVSQAIINIGKWFELDSQSILTKINTVRQITGFPLIGDKTTLEKYIEELRYDYFSLFTKYFDSLNENEKTTLVTFIVQSENYSSTLIEEFLQYYATMIGESISKRHANCIYSFKKIQENFVNFYENNVISGDFEINITDFKNKLSLLHNYTLPLQINCQTHGNFNKVDSEFVLGVRNKIVDWCNQSQSKITQLTETHSYDIGTVNAIISKTKITITFLDLMLKLIYSLSNYAQPVKKLDELLTKDKITLSNIRQDFKELEATLINSKNAPPKNTVNSSHQANSSATKSKENVTCNDVKWFNIIFRVSCIGCLITFIFTVVYFSNYATFSGVVMGIICLSLGVIARKIYKNDIEIETAKALFFLLIFVFIMTAILTDTDNSSHYDDSYNSSYGDNGSYNNSIYLNEENFKRYFNFSSTCATYNQNYGKYAEYTYSIYPRDDFNYNNSKNPSSISVIIGLDISSSSSYYGKPNEYKIYVTLNKSNGYRYSGKKTYTIYPNEGYWVDGIYSVDTKIYD